MTVKRNPIQNALLGAAIGDALGVPVEFTSRESLDRNPVKGMRSFGTYHQPAGTWSDDSSLMLCLADSLTTGYDLADIAEKMVHWYYRNLWTARGDVFDIGITTSKALNRLHEFLNSGQQDQLPLLKYDSDVYNNGNGALMRILPLLCQIKDLDLKTAFTVVQDVACLTHAHIRSSMACFIYLIYAKELLAGKEKFVAYKNMQQTVNTFFEQQAINVDEVDLFRRILQADVSQLERDEIRSGGYVMESIQASLWCLLTSDGYAETVLKAVNLGHDTDTTACIAGGLAGLAFGLQDVPENWLGVLARLEDIESLGQNLWERYS